jgi:hypothetical protein
VRLTALFVTPSCKVGAPGTCPAISSDPGVFSVNSATGAAGACNGVGFAVGAPAAGTGEVQLTPGSNIDLGPTTGPLAARTCTVDLTLHVNGLAATTPTHPLSKAALHGLVSQLDGTATGSAEISIVNEPPPPPPPPPQPPQVPPCGLPGSPSCIPTLSEWVMIMLAGFIVLIGALAVRKQRTT